MIFAEIMFADEKCWFEMLNEMLIKMLIEMLINDLMKFSPGCIQRWYVKCIDGFSDFAKKLHLTLKRSDALTNFRWCQKGCTLMIECTDGFSVLSESCTWRWNGQMHWRIFDVAKKVAPWRLNALTNWRFCQKTASDAETIKCTDELTIISLSQLQV